MKVIIGIDNGVTGSIGILVEGGRYFFSPVPVIKQQDYTKKKKNISRINIKILSEILLPNFNHNKCRVFIERPMVNSQRFNASISAVRALEATLIHLESHDIPYEFIDSKAWQKFCLPQGVKGTPELKKASLDIGCRYYPEYAEVIRKHKDADGILIARYGWSIA